MASIEYANVYPVAPIASAPSNGPRVKPRLNDAMLRAFAAGNKLSVDQPRDDRGPGRVVDREEAGLDGHDGIQEPHRLQAGSRMRDQEQRHHPQPDRCDQGKLATVHRVGESAAVQAERDQRYQREQADESDREGRLGDRIDLDRDRHRSHLLAELGDRIAEPESAIVRRHLKGSDVGQHPRKATAHGGNCIARRSAQNSLMHPVSRRTVFAHTKGGGPTDVFPTDL